MMSEPSLINRMAVTLIPTQACLDWINSCDDDQMTLDEIQREPPVYLLPQGKGEPEGQVSRHFEAMFFHELASWYTDETMYPKDLSFKTFKKLFTIQISLMVFDLGSGNIVKDDEN